MTREPAAAPVLWRALALSIGVVLPFATVVGALAYWPIRESQSAFKSDNSRFADNVPSVSSFLDFKNTYENNRVVSRNETIDKFNSVKPAITRLSDEMVPRKELERVRNGYDQQLEDQQRQWTR